MSILLGKNKEIQNTSSDNNIKSMEDAIKEIYGKEDIIILDSLPQIVLTSLKKNIK